MGLNDLSTAPIQDAVDVANLPEQFGGSSPLPQPGPYRWALSPLSDASFEPVDSPDYGPRVRVRFDESSPLVIVQSVGGEHNGEPFQTQLTNVPRRRGKAADAPIASDWDYLNKALGHTARPATNKAYATQLMADASERKQFSSDLEWTWNCNKNRPARFDNGQGGAEEVVDAMGQKTMGCGQKYYESSVPKVEGKFPRTITCQCGASVRAFANLTRFRA